MHTRLRVSAYVAKDLLEAYLDTGTALAEHLDECNECSTAEEVCAEAQQLYETVDHLRSKVKVLGL